MSVIRRLAKRLRQFPNEKGDAEKVSYYVLYGMITLTVLLFGAFFFIGYSHPFEDNPSFNAPMLTDVIIGFMLLLVITTLCVTVWTVVRSWKCGNKGSGVNNGIPASRIAWGTIAGMLILLVLTWLFSSTNAISINGKMYADTFWLRTAGMFVGTSLILLLVALCVVIYGYTRYYRKEK